MSSFRNWTSTAASALLLLSGQAMGQSYQIQVLPPLPGHTESFASGMNASGVVVGHSRIGSVNTPVRWDNGAPTGLGLLSGWLRATALDISTDGMTIVGEAYIGSGWVPCVWENGIAAQLPGPALNVSGCWQINDAGVIAGRAGGGGPGRACEWEKVNGAWVFTELSPSNGYAWSFAWGVSNTGLVMGASLNNWEDARATLWDTTTNIPSLVPGFSGNCTATSINAAGHLVGDLQVTPGGAWHAYFHDGIAPTDLGTLAYPNSYAHRINASGTIIGQSYADGVDPTAFPLDAKRAIIWRTGTMAAVNDLIPAGSGWDVKQLWDLNDSGHIAGYGRFNGLWRGCLLIPACYANCDASTAAPILNVADFGCFLNRFAGGDSYANCDGSTVAPVLNVADFSCFLNAFAAGCP